MHRLKVWVLIPLLWLGACKNHGSISNNEKIKTGKISLKILEKYDWYGAEYNRFVPKKSFLDSLKGLNNYSVLIFGGDWCSDTKFYLPQFVKLLSALNFPKVQLSIYFLDRSKQCVNCVNAPPEKYKVTRVPTFIILDKSGNEKGRITETPTKSLEEDLVRMELD